VLPPEPLQVSV
jgi:hypothetical protein